MSVRKPSVGAYPSDFAFWRDDTPKLTIINKDDFPERAVLEGMGIQGHVLRKGFGNCDPAEARERQEVMRFLSAHPELWSQFEALCSAPALPSTQDYFQTYFDPQLVHTPFWNQIAQFLDAVKPIDQLPKRLRVFAETLQSFLNLEADEREMGKVIGEMLESTAVLEGVLEIDCQTHGTALERLRKKLTGDAAEKDFISDSVLAVRDTRTLEFHGHRTFSYALSEARKKHYPNWVEQSWNPWRWVAGGLWKFIIDFQNKRQSAMAYEPMVINSSTEVVDDVTRAFRDFLTADPRLLEQCLTPLTFTLHFSYGNYADGAEGLRFRITNVRQTSEVGASFSFNFAHFAGYNTQRMQTIAKAQAQMREGLKQVYSSASDARLRARFLEIDPNTFNRTTMIPSPWTDKEHKWKALSNLYVTDDLQPTYEAVGNLREFCRVHMSRLLDMCDLLKRCVVKAKEFKSTLSFPEIVEGDGQNIVEFEELIPMHLGEVLKSKKVVPINGLPPINGTMIGLTGTHGGGKTVTEHTLVANIYLAQSGLPILGRRLRLNCKTHLGLVFIEGVSGQSVCQLLIRKTANVFKGIEGVDGKNVILVLDELGSATQERDGMQVALQVLEALNARQVSLLFSTQIMDVAVEAEKRFGAKCFMVDENHVLKPGIGSGDINRLVTRSGLGKYINRKAAQSA